MNVQYNVYTCTQPVSVDFDYVKVWQKYDYVVTFGDGKGYILYSLSFYHKDITKWCTAKITFEKSLKNRLFYKKILFLKTLQLVKTTIFD